jgi:hypothetical protein
MRVLILADDSLATRERELIVRLEVGLADEGVRVAYAVPRAVVEAEAAAGRVPTNLFAQALVYEPRGVPWSRRARLESLLGSLAPLGGDDESRRVDIVHAMGRGAWGMAGQLAATTGAGLVVSVWSAAVSRAAARLRPPHSPRGQPPVQPLFLVPDAALEKHLVSELDAAGVKDAVVRLAPWGVHAHAGVHEVIRPGRVVSLVLGGGGSDPPAYAAALVGLASLAARGHDLMVFADASVAARAVPVSLVKSTGLTERFTLVPEVEARRELALAADILLVPEAVGEHRSLVLDAMASGTLVVALADPLVSYLADGKTARLVERPDADAWSSAVGGLLTDRAAARALAESAREYTRQKHRVSSQVAAILDAYEWLAGRTSIPFDPSVAS